VDNSIEQTNPLTVTLRQDATGRLRETLRQLQNNWSHHGIQPWPVPLVACDSNQPRHNLLSERGWMTGLEAFNIYKYQSIENALSIACICQTISDQFDREERGLNYEIDCLPPNHDLLADFTLGSNQWFRALHSMLTLCGAEELDGWNTYVSDLHHWLVYGDHLLICGWDVLLQAMRVDWPYEEYSLPEAKQNPIWSFPQAMAWIATRDYLSLARLGVFYKSEGSDELVTDGVSLSATRALGWLQTVVAFANCQCGASKNYRWERARHCTCLSIAWEELVRSHGGLTEQTPELVFSADEGWLSMTWPKGADKLRFLRSDILGRWPARAAAPREAPVNEQSTTTGERDCREWLVQLFASDPEKRRSKRDFRALALAAFPGRLSERGFNLRVWPELAKEHGRDGAGAKRKS
jgi:hypothetical protein